MAVRNRFWGFGKPDYSKVVIPSEDVEENGPRFGFCLI